MINYLLVWANKLLAINVFSLIKSVKQRQRQILKIITFIFRQT